MKYLLNTNAVSGVFAIIVALVSKMKQGQLTAPGLINPLVLLEEVPEVWFPIQPPARADQIWNSQSRKRSQMRWSEPHFLEVPNLLQISGVKWKIKENNFEGVMDAVKARGIEFEPNIKD